MHKIFFLTIFIFSILFTLFSSSLDCAKCDIFKEHEFEDRADLDEKNSDKLIHIYPIYDGYISYKSIFKYVTSKKEIILISKLFRPPRFFTT